MNILQVQDRLKGLSEQQLAQEMQMPSGMAPQFLVLSELQRRKRVRDEFQSEKAKAPMTTVAQDAVAAAGVPQAPMAQMATAMAPQTDVTQNTGIASLPTAPSPEPQRMAGGGPVRKMQDGRAVSRDDEWRGLTPEGVGDAKALALLNDLLNPIENAKQSYSDYNDGDYLGAAINAASIVPVGKLVGIGGKGLRLGVDGAMMAAPSVYEYFYPSEEPQMKSRGGPVRKMQEGRIVRNGTVYILQPDGSYLPEAAAPELREVDRARAAGLDSFTLGDVFADFGITFGSGTGQRAIPGPGRSPVPETPQAAEPMGPPMPTEEERAAMAAASEETAAPTPPAQDTTSSSSGGGAGGGAGSSPYEQALVDAMARAEKRADQDKWLAMAQAGLALMTSKQPTLGGALGEAGLAGIDQYRGSRDDAEKTKMDILAAQYQMEMDKQNLALARAKLAAGGGGGRTPIGMLTKLAADRDAIALALEALPPVEEDGWFFSGSDPAAAERQALTERLRLADQALTIGYAQYGYPYLGGISSLPEDDEFNAADE